MTNLMFFMAIYIGVLMGNLVCNHINFLTK